ncbi:ATP-binding protein [Arcticibacter sp. MXS-1]|uniref:ATP-binding protein n=1 Tax=Arcticibacter sp. MXS-1 TaxID=3341726 RepID=UPI0035A90662
MSATFKIRVLLFILAVGFVVTAVSVHHTFSQAEVLRLDARKIEKNLQAKEKYVYDFLNNKTNFKALKSIHKNPAKAAELIQSFRDGRLLYLHTYYNDQLVFWGANRIVPSTSAGLKEGSNRIKTTNGWYEAIKKSEGNFSVVCCIPIKADYPFQNKYLRNVFAPDLISENNLEIAQKSDQNVYNIRNIKGESVVAVKLKSTIINSYHSTVELWMVLLAVLFATIFINQLCSWIASRSYILAAILVFCVYFVLVKYLSIRYPIMNTYFNVGIFDTRHYSGGGLFRSLGDFLFNALALSWLLCFIYSYRKDLTFKDNSISRPWAVVVFVLLGLVMYVAAQQHSRAFYDLIVHSNINFDLTNVLYLDVYSWLAILLLYSGAFNLYLILEILLSVGKGLPLTNRQKLLLFLVGLAGIWLIQLFTGDYTGYIFLFGIIILIKGWTFYTQNESYSFLVFLTVVLLFSIIASIKLSSFQYIKEREQRKIIANNLESADDPNAVLLFFSVEQEILKDQLIIDSFKPQAIDNAAIVDKLRKIYFDGYLSRYEFETFSYQAGQEAHSADSANIHIFKNLVLAGSIKVSENFYRVNNTFGLHHYFAILPIREAGRMLGTLIINLKSKTFKDPGSVPDILVDSKMNTDKELENYSFAFYSHGRLLNQNGSYIYNLVNNDFKGGDTSFTFIEKNGFNHLIYKPNANKVIVVSRPITTWVMRLASVSFLFLVMIACSLVILAIHQIWLIFHDDNLKSAADKWTYLLSRNRILYRTRIQASLVSAIILTLLIVGVITYVSISRQFRHQLEDDVMRQVNQISNGLEKNNMFNTGSLAENEEALHSFAEVNAADLSLFDTDGKLVYTTESKIYENGFIEPRMNAFAYIFLNKYQRSEFLNTEQVGRMKYLAAYKPLRNNRNKTIAYLCLPYFSNEADYDQRIGQYLNTTINVYALVLVVIALFAIFLANQITYPLTLVGKSLSEIKIDGKNEPIEWKSNDEIGSLIKEYNNMIIALEESAKKLARSERESAWREMAKQVAHEIKNPLTPLKLGVQLLEKSWKENDPNFNKKFAKFSKSFIEQIESLAHIASEFSNFAKLPDTPFENINIAEVIIKSVATFNADGHHINLSLPAQPVTINGNKDHLLRIFNNLIQNAVEAIPEERPENIRIDLTVQKKNVYIKVEDNGNGISEDLKEKIFNPNFTTKTSGTGLGLAFVKQATENMLGSIHYETTPGTGTVFHIVLPTV